MKEKSTHLTHGTLENQTKILTKAKNGGSGRAAITRGDGPIGPTTINGTLMVAVETNGEIIG
eukprot:658519-Karenia_brevis.AAC.1